MPKPSLSTSDRRIGTNRTPMAIAQELVIQVNRIGINHAGGRGQAPRTIACQLLEEINDLVDPEWADQIIAECANIPQGDVLKFLYFLNNWH